MNRVGWVILIGFVIFFEQARAQPKPCGANPMMTTYCQDACIICDIDGFKGRHDSKVAGSLPRGFCTTTVHNSQWISFIAGSTDLQIQLTVSNCVRGDGLEMTIYESRDCNTFVQVFNCDGEVRPGSTMTFTNNRPLTIGQYYYLAMDGNNGDNCDWSLKVTKGTTKVTPLTNSGLVAGPRVTCPNVPVIYEVDVPTGATEFSWKVNGVPTGLNDSVFNYTFPRAGVYTICMQAANVCDTAPETCFNVVVKTIPPTDLNVTLCPGECYAIGGDLLCSTGFHEVHIPLNNGCDSIVRVNLVIEQPQTQELKVNICFGDTLWIGSQPLTHSGLHSVHLSTLAGCDSMVLVDLFVVQCDIEGQGIATDATCYDAQDGTFVFRVQQGSPLFTYRLSNGVDTMLRYGSIRALDEEVAFVGLQAGTYFVEIGDLFTNREILIFNISEPEALQAFLNASDYHGYGVDCYAGSSGQIDLDVLGGTLPYSYLWSTGKQTAQINGLTAGDYQVTVSDGQGCSTAMTTTLTSPLPLALEVASLRPDCSNLQSGALSVLLSSGGVPEFDYSLDGQSWQKELVFTALPPGPYEITMRDANGCRQQVRDTIPHIVIPSIQWSGPLTVDLGQSVRIEPTYQPAELESYQWTPDLYLDCTDCPYPSAMPLKSGFYTIRATSADGCPVTDSVLIQVIKKRYVYIPNAFHPGGSANPMFKVHTGPGVISIESLQVFDRWGNVVYTESKSPVAVHSGWDGQYRQNPAEVGVYTWVAQIKFIDDEVETFAGDVTLWR